jgi:hypothetical protein
MNWRRDAKWQLTTLKRHVRCSVKIKHPHVAYEEPHQYAPHMGETCCYFLGHFNIQLLGSGIRLQIGWLRVLWRVWCAGVSVGLRHPWHQWCRHGLVWVVTSSLHSLRGSGWWSSHLSWFWGAFSCSRDFHFLCRLLLDGPISWLRGCEVVQGGGV